MGEIVVAWSGRVLAALAIFLVGRLIARALTRWFSRAVQRVGLDATFTNYNAEATRRVDLTIAIGYDADIAQAKSVIEAVVAAEARIARQPVPEIAVQDLLHTAVTLAVRVWVKTGDYGVVRSELLERIKRVLDKYSLSIPTEQRALPAAAQTASK